MAEKISDDYIDQLPMLKHFKKWLLQLSISNPPSSSSHMKANFMIETVAELREGLIRRYVVTSSLNINIIQDLLLNRRSI